MNENELQVKILNIENDREEYLQAVTKEIKYILLFAGISPFKLITNKENETNLNQTKIPKTKDIITSYKISPPKK